MLDVSILLLYSSMEKLCVSDILNVLVSTF